MTLRSVFCLVTSRGRADLLIMELRAAEVSTAEISLLFLEQGQHATPAARGLSAAAAESAAPIRGVCRDLDKVGPLALAGVGPLIVGGPIASALRGAKVGSSVADGLVDFGVPALEAARYETRIKKGHTLIAVHLTNSDRSDRARELFTAAAAEDIFTLMQMTSTRALPDISAANAA